MQGRLVALTAALALLAPALSAQPPTPNHRDPEIHSPPWLTVDPGPTVCGPTGPLLDPPLPHPPITIDGSDPSKGFTTTDPTTGEDEPRPGSGVTSGNGTAEDPYIIEDWAIPSLTIQNTRAHVLIRDTLIYDPWDFPYPLSHTGPLEDRGRIGGILPEAMLHLENATNVSLVASHVHEGGRPFLIDAPGTCLAHNLLDLDGHGSLRLWQSPRTVLVNNTIPSIRLARSAHATLHHNELTSPHGLSLSSPDAQAEATHNITPTNTVAGDPLRYYVNATDVTVPSPTGQLIAVNTTNLTLRNHTVDSPLQIADARDVHLTNLTAPYDQIETWRTSNLTIEHSTIGGDVLVREGRGLVFRNNTVETSLGVGLSTSATGSRIVNNIFNGSADPQVQVLADGALVANNILTGGYTGLVVTGNETLIQDNRFENLIYEAVRGGAVDVRIENNVVNNVRTILIEGDHSQVVFANNTVDTRTDAIQVTAGQIRVENNDLAAASEAVDLQGLWEGSTVAEVHGNTFYNDSDAGVSVSGDVTANATLNYWGCPHGPDHPDCTDVVGEVPVEPWLIKPNPQAGAE